VSDCTARRPASQYQRTLSFGNSAVDVLLAATTPSVRHELRLSVATRWNLRALLL